MPLRHAGVHNDGNPQNNIRVRSGVEDVRLHDLRRKAGSDVEAAETTRLLAHQDAKITKKHYRAKPARVKPVR